MALIYVNPLWLSQTVSHKLLAMSSPLAFNTCAWCSFSPIWGLFLQVSPSSEFHSMANGLFGSGVLVHSPFINWGRDSTLSQFSLRLNFQEHAYIATCHWCQNVSLHHRLLGGFCIFIFAWGLWSLDRRARTESCIGSSGSRAELWEKSDSDLVERSLDMEKGAGKAWK